MLFVRRPGWTKRRARIADFWRGYLNCVPPMLRWKTADPAVAIHAGGSHAFTVPAELRDALTRLGARHRATPFMALLAVWGLQLAVESGRNDFVVGTAVACRPTPESEQLIGLFVNSLPIRARVMPALPFDQYLSGIRDASLAAFANQELPFNELVRLLRRAGERHANPVFQVMLTFDSLGADEIAPLPHLGVHVLEQAKQTSHLDLALSLRPQGDAWGATLTYSRALFSAAEAERLADDFVALMRAAVAEPALQCHELGGKCTFAEEHEW
jgi:non-ribosomal peptide synthetase component F